MVASRSQMRGELVRLRACEKSDADALFRWFSDEEVTRWTRNLSNGCGGSRTGRR